MTPLPRLAEVLGAAVRMRDLRVGTVTGVFGDADFVRMIGLEVTSADGVRRFLPRVAAPMREGVVRLGSTLVLVETGELDGYGRLGARVVRDPMQLAGLGVDPDGRIVRVGGDRGVSPDAASGISVA